MPLHAPTYTILMDDPDRPETPATESTVVVRNADQLRAELEGSKLGLGGRGMSAAPLNYTTLWLWAAMTRTGAWVGTFQEFKAQLVAFQPLDPDGDKLTEGGEVPEVDPTNPDRGTGSP